jgi:hypothetical protein
MIEKERALWFLPYYLQNNFALTEKVAAADW